MDLSTLKQAQELKSKLDNFVEAGSDLRHEVTAVHDDTSAMIVVELTDTATGHPQPVILAADDPTAEELEQMRRHLRRRHSQWIYFDRGLRVYDGQRTYLFKPMQRMLWTASNALMDGTEIIADILAGAELQHAETA